MKNWSLRLLTLLLPFLSFGQKNTPHKDTNTLLWQISGNGLRQPSYLFGTIHMLCKDDAVLSDRVKTFFQEKSGLIPFSMLETYKPLLAVSTLAESAVPCESAIAMEQLIMEEAKRNNNNIKGLETMAYQAGIFDSIPYKLQAEQLLSYIDSSGSG